MSTLSADDALPQRYDHVKTDPGVANRVAALEDRAVGAQVDERAHAGGTLDATVVSQLEHDCPMPLLSAADALP